MMGWDWMWNKYREGKGLTPIFLLWAPELWVVGNYELRYQRWGGHFLTLSVPKGRESQWFIEQLLCTQKHSSAPVTVCACVYVDAHKSTCLWAEDIKEFETWTWCHIAVSPALGWKLLPCGSQSGAAGWDHVATSKQRWKQARKTPWLWACYSLAIGRTVCISARVPTGFLFGAASWK